MDDGSPVDAHELGLLLEPLEAAVDVAQRTAELIRTVGDLVEKNHHADTLEALALSEQVVALQPENAEALAFHGEVLYFVALRCRRERRSHGGRIYFLRSAEVFCAAHEKDPSLLSPLAFCGQDSLGRCYHVLRTVVPGWSTMCEDARERAIEEWIEALQVYSPTAAAQQRHFKDMTARVASLEQELRLTRSRLETAALTAKAAEEAAAEAAAEAAERAAAAYAAASSSFSSARQLLFAKDRRLDVAAECVDVPDAPAGVPGAAMQTGLMLLCSLGARAAAQIALSDPGSSFPLSPASFGSSVAVVGVLLAAAAQAVGARCLARLWSVLFLGFPVMRLVSFCCMSAPSLAAFTTFSPVLSSCSMLVFFSIGLIHSTIELATRTKLRMMAAVSIALTLGVSGIVAWRTTDTSVLGSEMRKRLRTVLLPCVSGYLVGDQSFLRGALGRVKCSGMVQGHSHQSHWISGPM